MKNDIWLMQKIMMDIFKEESYILKKLKFVILTPRNNSGGAIVRHRLCSLLRDNGYDARVLFSGVYGYRPDKKFLFFMRWIKYICKDTIKIIVSKIYPNAVKKYPGLKVYLDYPVKGWKRKYLPLVDKNTIVIYPEVTYGNPLNAKKVVRWFLYYNPLHGQIDAYGKDDLFFCYGEKFNDSDLNPEKRILRTPYFNLDLYKQTNFDKRKGKCYIIRKAKDRQHREDLPETFDGIVVDDLPEKEKVKVFNECEYCICYDTFTAYSTIASLCGCISVVIPEPGKTKEDYIIPGVNNWGKAWSFEPEEIEFAKNTRHKIYEMYLKSNADSETSAKEFIKVCEKYFNTN